MFGQIIETPILGTVSDVLADHPLRVDLKECSDSSLLMVDQETG